VAPPLDIYLAELRADIEQALARVVPASTPAIIADPVRYSLLSGGKRMRPCLTMAVAEATGVAVGLSVPVTRALARPAACAVEMIHSYSLVHDDLPAMDDDALRRGRPTTHVVYGEGLAILAGDGLLTDAFAVLAAAPSPASAPGDPAIDAARRLRAVEQLAQAAGSRGMVGGQAIDLAAVGRLSTAVPSDDDRPAARTAAGADGAAALEDMHRRKTGALIEAAATLGAIVTGAPESTVAGVAEYARELGLAFQIVDDILDVEGSAEALGKTAGKDAAAGKPTFPAFYGVDGSKRLAAACVARAKAALGRAALSGRLADLADWSLARRR
jgi:geranylgeranyl pyrophosphate synthase